MVRHTARQPLLPWEDRFNTPTVDDLRDAIAEVDEEALDRFDEACDLLAEICRGPQEIMWQGECWKWTLSYRLSRRKRGPRAIIIPNPGDLQIAMRIDDGFLDHLNPARFRRAVRDGLDLAADPFDTDWTVWPVSSGKVLSEIIQIIRAHVEYAKPGARN